jgi:hypothetical protein
MAIAEVQEIRRGSRKARTREVGRGDVDSSSTETVAEREGRAHREIEEEVEFLD